MKHRISLILKGMSMGMAEVVPGVSGGTIAFITGIYEKLLNTIKYIGPELIIDFKEGGVKQVWEKLDGLWLITLISGMAFGIIVGVFGISYLLETYPTPLWSFFFGLIIASALYIAKKVDKWVLPQIASLVIGTIIAYVITVISPAEGNNELWFVFLSGVIAISALILPGISGSFILLIMGMYFTVIGSVKELLSNFNTESLLIVAVFAGGCLTGLATFSRVLSWTFKHYKNATLALLTGFMLGSLNKIWPWRTPSLGLDKTTGEIITLQPKANLEEIKVLSEIKMSPFEYETILGDSLLIPSILFCLIGIGIVFFLDKIDQKNTSSN